MCKRKVNNIVFHCLIIEIHSISISCETDLNELDGVKSYVVPIVYIYIDRYIYASR